MKRFLYYNQDSVNSFLAQIEQGLLVKKSDGEEASDTASTSTGTRADVTGDLSAKVFGIGAALKGDIQSEETVSEAATSLIQQVHEKVLHDYAFEMVYEYITANQLANNTNPRIGDIVLINEQPVFMDFKYMQALFADNGAGKLINDQNKKKYDELKDSTKGKQIPVQAKIELDKMKVMVANAETERKETAKMIEVIQNTLPFKRFVMTSNMLIPLDDDSFRDDPDTVAFKYGGEMTILGYVTNIISSEKSEQKGNKLTSLYSTINQIMLTLYEGQDHIFVVHPVAIYY